MVKIIFKLHQICREKTRGLQCLFNEVRKKPVVGFKIIYIFKRFHTKKTINTVLLKFRPSSLRIQKITEKILIKSSFFSAEKNANQRRNQDTDS